MFQPARESWLAFATKRAASLAFAGLVASLVLVVAGGAGRPPGDAVTGLAQVVDGDTLIVSGVRVRLEGIDAPEIEQTCGSALSSWRCGIAASQHLQRRVTGRTVVCKSRGHDAYGRLLGVCTADGLELNADLVQNGLAWAFVRYSTAYVDVENRARSQRIGIWSGSAQPAWEWRTSKWDGSTAQAPQGCPIKGNVSRNGHVYHLPWDPYYARTSVELRRGERWFCSEAEAIAAGWRHAGGR